MEYRRAYWGEQADNYLIERHEREIFPLLRKRYLFAEVRDFLLYDFYTPDGYVNEDVFAYSNQSGKERALVVYHNRYSSTKGWIRNSAAYSVKTSGGERMLIQRHLAEGLNLENHGDTFTIFRDHISGLEYIRNNHMLHENGLYIELDAYKYHVFLDFRQVRDNEFRQYSQLAAYLNGSGVPSIDEAMKEIFLRPIHMPFQELINPGFLHWVITNRQLDVKPSENIHAVLDEAEQKSIHLLKEIENATQNKTDVKAIASDIRELLSTSLELPSLMVIRSESKRAKGFDKAYSYLRIHKVPSPWKQGSPFVWGTLLGWVFTSQLGKVISRIDYEEISRSWIDEWILGKMIATAMSELGLDERTSWRAVSLIKLLVKLSNWCFLPLEQEFDISSKLQILLADQEVQDYLGVNRYQDILWFNKESFDDLLWWLFVISVVENKSWRKEEADAAILKCYQGIKHIQETAKESGYQVEKLLTLINKFGGKIEIVKLE
jgi:hypothetical protein